MPIYEYVCDVCGGRTEVLQKVTEPPPAGCPSGDGGRLTKAISAHNVGGVASGWEGAACDQSLEPTCRACGKAGTGCA